MRHNVLRLPSSVLVWQEVPRFDTFLSGSVTGREHREDAMKKFYPKDMYVARYDGVNIIIKATTEDMEYLVRNDPKMVDYSLLEAYKLETNEKRKRGVV